MRRYAEFFTDFAIQEPQLIKVDPLTLSCAILAATRKHMNLEIIWNQEMEQLTTFKFAQFKEVFAYVDRRYTKSFPDSVKNQEKLANGRQKLEQVLVATDNLKSVEVHSARYGGSATTQPNTHGTYSAATYSTKYGTIGSAECIKSSGGKTIEDTTASASNIENESIKQNNL